MVTFPNTKEEYIKAVTRETARMSYPGSMSRGKSPILEGGTKKYIENEFFPTFLSGLWDTVDIVADQFDDWHEKQTISLGRSLSLKRLLGNPGYGEAVGAKLINTFMYQLMKYDHFRPLWSKLHLPLDRMMINALSELESPALCPVKDTLNDYKGCPYRITYKKEYKPIQEALWQLVAELNKRPDVGYNLTSRIELNLLWAD